jgi:predicted metalloprotease
MLFDQLVESILGEEATQRGMDTDWKNNKGDQSVHLKDVIKYLDENNVAAKEVNISLIKPIIIKADYENRKSRIKGVKLKYPIIVVKKNGKYKSILDGNHRAYKALKEGKKKILIREIDLSSKDTPKIYKDLFDYNIEKLN